MRIMTHVASEQSDGIIFFHFFIWLLPPPLPPPVPLPPLRPPKLATLPRRLAVAPALPAIPALQLSGRKGFRPVARAQ